MKVVKIFAMTMVAFVASTNVQAQFTVGADVVSNYVWRGVQQDVIYTSGTPNVQPSITFTTGKFTIGAWGSASILGSTKEVDLFATYAFSNLLSVTVTDYNWNFSKNYFSYGQDTDHVFEASINYAGVASFPLGLSFNTMFYGADKITTSTETKQAYSSYLELAYPVSKNAKLYVGGALNESAIYGTNGFGITNIALRTSKSIDISDKLSLMLYGILGLNPTAKDAFMVLGITL